MYFSKWSIDLRIGSRTKLQLLYSFGNDWKSGRMTHSGLSGQIYLTRVQCWLMASCMASRNAFQASSTDAISKDDQSMSGGRAMIADIVCAWVLCQIQHSITIFVLSLGLYIDKWPVFCTSDVSKLVHVSLSCISDCSGKWFVNGKPYLLKADGCLCPDYLSRGASSWAVESQTNTLP